MKQVKKKSKKKNIHSPTKQNTKKEVTKRTNSNEVILVCQGEPCVDHGMWGEGMIIGIQCPSLNDYTAVVVVVKVFC